MLPEHFLFDGDLTLACLRDQIAGPGRRADRRAAIAFLARQVEE